MRQAPTWKTAQRRNKGLRYVAHMLTSAFTLDEVLHYVTETASLAAQAESAYVELADAGADEITYVASYGPGVPATGTKGQYSGSLAEEVLARRQPRIIRDAMMERERRSIFGELALTCQNCTAMVVPLIADSALLGALFLIRRHPAYFTEAEFPRVITLVEMGGSPFSGL
jgi:GAF domain-containing protein